MDPNECVDSIIAEDKVEKNDRLEKKQKNSKNAKYTEQAAEIMELYKKSVSSGKEKDLNALIQKIDEYIISFVRKQLWNCGVYSDYNKDTVMDNGRIAVWKNITSDHKNKVFNSYFTDTVLRIYTFKCIDVYRHYKKLNNKDSESLNEPIDESGKTLIDMIPDYSDPEAMAMRAERGRLMKDLLLLYIKTYMDTKIFLPTGITLYYSKMLLRFRPELAESEERLAKQAYEYIKGSNMKKLTNEAQDGIRKYTNEDLKWKQEFMNQLNDKLTINNVTYILEKAIYTDLYSKNKFDDWAEYMHKQVRIAMAKKLRKPEHKDLFEAAKEYIDTRDKRLSKILEGGKK